MKHIETILVFISLLVCCISCKKDPKNTDPLSSSIASRFVKENDVVSAEMFITCSSSTSIKKVTLLRSFSEDLSGAVEVEAVKEGDAFRATFPVLMDTIYYCQYVVHRYSYEFEKEMEIESDSIYSLSTHGVRLPSVTTKGVKFISQSQALGWGTVTDDCGEAVTQKGICWSLQASPRLNNSYDVDGAGMGDCYVQMKDLASKTHYYARAYAMNKYGISYANNEISFQTKGGDIVVKTLVPSDVTTSSAQLRGEVTLKDTYAVFPYFLIGVTPLTDITVAIWPAIIGNYTSNINTSFNQPFDVIVSDLDYETTYFVRAFVIDKLNNKNDTIFGDVKSFTTNVSSFEPVGELNGSFSVGPDQQVQFSPGNLQYQASTNQWRFARQQWEFVGKNNKNLSSTYHGWIDLFGWGTSSNNHGAVCYQPWSNSSSYSDYYAYGSADYNLNDQTGLADWGSNPIYWGDEVTEGWRTMTSSEWNYLFNTRTTASGIRYAKSQLNIVNGTTTTPINGIVVFPDEWIDNGLVSKPNDPESSFTSNVISVSDWKDKYESKGAVFLPAAGRRSGTYYYQDTNEGCYWSATKYDYRVSHPYFFEDGFGADYLSLGYFGYSVRLVRSTVKK